MLKLGEFIVASGSNASDNISDNKYTLHRIYRIFYK